MEKNSIVSIIQNQRDAVNQEENEEYEIEQINVNEENLANSKVTPQIKQKKKNNMFSLTSLPVEMGDLKLIGEQIKKQETTSSTQKSQQLSFFKKIFKAKEAQKKLERIQQKNIPLPFPRILTITQLVYCIYNANIMDLYRYDELKQKDKKRNMFVSLTDKEAITYSSDIIFISGYRNSLIVGLKNMFYMYNFNKSQSQDQKSSKNVVHQKLCYHIQGILSGKFEEENILILTKDKLLKLKVQNNTPKLINSYPFIIKYSQNVSSIKILDIIKQNTMYFIVYTEKIQKSHQQNKESDEKKIPRIKQVLKLIEFYITSNESIYYEICKMPEAGLFDLSKVFYKEKFKFLISLHEEIVLIEKIHKKYIAVDNITVNSNKLAEQSKKGQLVLVNEQKIIYNDNQQIYVYNFSHDDNTMKLDLLDNFKAPQANQSFILYDGILLQNINTNIQVLFYFNSREIKRPGKQDYTISKNSDEQSHDKITFLIFGIKQMKPLLKLYKLLRESRQPKQIDDFIIRFQIERLEYLKVSWQVSKKTINDIITHLLPIGDSNFIKNQLNEILKKQPHDMNFLTEIEQAQNNQLKDQLTKFLIKNSQNIDQPNNKETFQTLIISVLESNMFYKKLKYMGLFEAYKLIDFTDIQKLKAVSLKEEIKLLSCKGYELRLRYFLNHFKYLAIANFEEIFTFLVQGKTEDQIKEFFISFHFIFPESTEKSILNCFFKAQEEVQKQKNSVSIQCQLWNDFGNSENTNSQAVSTKKERPSNAQQSTEKDIGPAETIESFANSVIIGKNIAENEKTIIVQTIKKKMQTFKQQKWFKEGSFQKHCMLSIDQKTLIKQFRQLKDSRVCNIIYKYLYENVKSQKKREEIIKNLIIAGRISRSTSANFKIRQIIFERFFKNTDYTELKLPDFLILKDVQFFNLLYNIAQKKKNFFFKTIKNIYEEEKIVNDKGFFEEKFNSYLIQVKNIDQIIYFLEQFSNLDNKIEHQNLLQIILQAITNILNIRAKQDTQKVLVALDHNDEWFQPHVQTARKIIQGNCFYQLYDSFQLTQYTYAKLNKAAQQTTNNQFINSIIKKFCQRKFKNQVIRITEILAHQQNSKFINEVLIASPDRKVKTLHIKEPIQFFRCLIEFRQRLSFEISISDILKIFILQLIKMERYDEISIELFNVLKDQNQDQQPAQNLENIILQYVKSNLYEQSKLQHYKKCLELIKPITISAKQEIALLDLCKNMVQLEKQLPKKLQVREALNQNPLNFLMNILKITGFANLNKRNWENTQPIFEKIYEKFLEARSIDLLFAVQAKKQAQFYEFQMEAGYYFLQNDYVKKSIEICERLIYQDVVYYFDLIFSSACYLVADKANITQAKFFLKYVVHLIIFENKQNDADKDQGGSYKIDKKFPVNNHEMVIQQLSKIANQKIEDAQTIIINCSNNFLDRINNLSQDLKAKFPPVSTILDETGRKIFLLDQYLDACIVKTATKGLIDEKTPLNNLVEIFYFTFVEILEQNPIQSFYFLMKNKILIINKIVDFLDKHTLKPEFYKYLSLVIYLRALNQVFPQFYPTISFFHEKLNILDTDQTCRDINILIQKLRCLQLQKKTNQPLANALSKTYQIYMTSINKPYLVNLTEIPLESNDQDHTRQINTKLLKQKIHQQISQNQRKFKEGINKIPNFKDTTPIYPSFSKPIFDIPLTNTNFKPQLPSQKYQSYQKVKLRELPTLKMKEQQTIKIETKFNSQIEQILEKYKLKREQRLNKLSEKQKSIVAISEKNINISNIMNPNHKIDNNAEKQVKQRIAQYQLQRKSNLDQFQVILKKSESQAKINNNFVQSIKNEDQKSVNLNAGAKKNSQNLIFQSIFTKQPRKQSANFHQNDFYQKPQKPYDQIKHRFEKRPMSNLIQPPQKQVSVTSSISQLRRKMQENQNKLTNIPTKVSIDDIKKELKANNQLQILKYLQKLAVVTENTTLCKELIRRMYEVSKNLKSFVHTLELLLKVYDNYQKFFEKKSLKIVSQSLKIETKIQPKAIFDFTFFSDVQPNLNEKQYQKHTFKRLRPNISKVINDNNMHSLAKMILYGLGLQKKYEIKVYIVYLETKFEDYLSKDYDQKLIANLIEKIKSIFGKLPKEKRNHKLTKLLVIKAQQNPKKMKQITRIMEETISRTFRLRNIAPNPEDEDLLQIFKKLC